MGALPPRDAPMRITILCSSRNHPVWRHMEDWSRRQTPDHEVHLCEKRAEVTAGDILFLISCNEIIRADVRGRFARTLVIHASDVPHGRGFAPLNWQVLEGRDRVVVTLMEAADKVDSGDVWAKREMHLTGHETFDELFAALFAIELELMDFAVASFHSVTPTPQPSTGGTYYRRRTPEDSRVVAGSSLAEIFDLLRVSDPERYPVTFEHRGYRYALSLRKLGPVAVEEPELTSTGAVRA